MLLMSILQDEFETTLEAECESTKTIKVFSYHSSIVNTKTFMEKKTDSIFLGTLEQRTKNDVGFHKFMDDEADRMRRDVQEHLSAVVVSQIEIQGFVAVPTAEDADADSCYYLWINL